MMPLQSSEVNKIICTLKAKFECTLKGTLFGNKVNSSLTYLDPKYLNKFLKEMTKIYCRATDYLKKWYNFKINTSEYFSDITLNNNDLRRQDFNGKYPPKFSLIKLTYARQNFYPKS
jgi:hypothetical protein